MKEWLIKLVSVYDRVLDFFQLDEAFWKIFYSYKDIIKEYYLKLFINFVNTLKDKSFWYKIFYNNKFGIFYNLLLLLCFAPIFRFIWILVTGILMLIYSVYYILINFIFDLIIKYIDVYAKKIHVLYDSSLIEEINDLRTIMLLVKFKENFLENFKARRDVNIDGFIYKEEFHLKVGRIFFNVILFFIWSLPLFLSFFSYLVRAAFSLIKSYFLIFFWYNSAKFVKFLREKYIRHGLKVKIYNIRFWKFNKKIMGFFKKFKRKNIINFNKYYNALLLKIFDRIYDDVSIYFKVRKKILKLKVKKLKKIYRKQSSKNKKLKLALYDQYIYNYYLLKNPINADYFINKIFKINLFNFISDFIDDKIVNRLKLINENAKEIDNIDNTKYHPIYFKYLLVKSGSFFHRLNYNSILIMVHFFIGKYFNDYDFFKFRSKFFRRFRVVYLRIKSKFIYHIYYKIYFPFYVVIRTIFFWIYWFFYLIFSIFYYIFLCLFYSIIIFLKFLWYLIIIIFFGREK